MTQIRIRAAKPQDATEVSDVLIRSITKLCNADHQDDPKLIAGWIENKTPQDILSWINGPAELLISESNDSICAVGLYQRSGEIQLLYVAPEARGQGHSSALLVAMETALASLGISNASLISSRTAQAFYLSRGWRLNGAQVACYTTDGQPMQKALSA